MMGPGAGTKRNILHIGGRNVWAKQKNNNITLLRYGPHGDAAREIKKQEQFVCQVNLGYILY
jgi:hypothetical protein